MGHVDKDGVVCRDEPPHNPKLDGNLNGVSITPGTDVRQMLADMGVTIADAYIKVEGDSITITATQMPTILNIEVNFSLEQPLLPGAVDWGVQGESGDWSVSR